MDLLAARSHRGDQPGEACRWRSLGERSVEPFVYTRACAAALHWLDNELPGEPVVLFTQTANTRSMRLAAKLGFTEVERFHAWDAEQWHGQRPPATPSG